MDHIYDNYVNNGVYYIIHSSKQDKDLQLIHIKYVRVYVVTPETQLEKPELVKQCKAAPPHNPVFGVRRPELKRNIAQCTCQH